MQAWQIFYELFLKWDLKLHNAEEAMYEDIPGAAEHMEAAWNVRYIFLTLFIQEVL